MKNDPLNIKIRDIRVGGTWTRRAVKYKTRADVDREKATQFYEEQQEAKKRKKGRQNPQPIKNDSAGA